MDIYVIWSISKAGWVSKAANYTSQLEDAKQWPQSQAIEQCIKHPAYKALDWMPVRLNDLQQVKALIK